MSAPYFVELLARTGEVEHRLKFISLPIRIGRAYTNDVILDDEHSAPEHAVIEMDSQGELVARDLGSKNGLIVRGKRESETKMTPDNVIRIGQTHLRLRDASYQVAPEQIDKNNYSWEGWVPSVFALVALVFYFGLKEWFEQTEEPNFNEWLQRTFYLVCCIFLWTGLWAAGTRLFTRHPRFGRHFFIASFALLSIDLYFYFASYVGFMFSLEFLTRYAEYLAIFIICIGLTYHLRLVIPKLTRMRRSISILCCVILCGVTYAKNHKASGGASAEFYMSNIHSSNILLTNEKAVDDFVNALDSVKEALEKDRSKKPSNPVDEE